MNRFSSLLVCGLMVGSTAACGGSDGTPDATVPTDAASGNDAVSTDGSACGVTPGPAGVMSGCYTEFDCSPVCPTGHVANSATTPNFRITAIKVTAPATLASAPVNNLLNGFLSSRAFLWGVSFNFTSNIFRTGPLDPQMVTAGPTNLGHLGDTYKYFDHNAPTTGGTLATRWDPATSMVSLMGNTATVSPMLAAPIRLPIFTTTFAVVTELPLNNAVMHGVVLSADRGCIGVARTDSTTANLFNECSGSAWYTEDPTTMTPYGVLEADISVADAENIPVQGFNNDLCSVISGQLATPHACTTVPQAMWPTQPTGVAVSGGPSFHLVADFAAISTNISN